MTSMHGTWYVVSTPFLADGSLDDKSQRRLIDAAIGWGVDGLTVMGVMSEVASLSTDERSAALRAIFDAAAGRVPIAVGCSGASPASVVEQVRAAHELGATAAMVSAPPLLRNVDLLPEFYASVARDGGLPLVVQDEPAATGVLVPVSILLRSLKRSGARVVKLEDPPTPPKIARLLAGDPTLEVFGGLGGMSALGELRRGACGTMTGFAFPEILRAVRAAGEAGDWRRAGQLFDRYLPLIGFEAQPVVGLLIRKEILRRRGVIAHGTTRAIVSRLDPLTLTEIDELLDRLGLVPAINRLEP